MKDQELNRIEKFDWKTEYGEELTVEMLRVTYTPPNKFRVSKVTYQAGETIHARRAAGKCFVVEGSLTFKNDSGDLRLDAGEWAELPAGGFELTIGNERDVELVNVWEIPAM